MSAPDHATAPATTPAAEDLRALSWVQDEVRRSLEAAHKSLNRHLREAEALRGSDVDRVDPSVLRSARVHIHQAAGALELIGMTVPALFLRASEQAVQRLSERPSALNAAAVSTIEHASFALVDYIGRLTAGKKLSGVALFPQYRGLLELAGADRVHPADLWEHDWRWRVIAREPGIPAQSVDPQAREIMERLILRLMRTPDRTTLRRMSDLCAALGADAKGRRATMWRLAAGFFEAQAAGLLPYDVHVKRAAPRLLAQARLGLRSGDVSDRLAHDLLFFCARANQGRHDPSLQRLNAVLQAYALEDTLLPDYEAPALGRFDPSWIGIGRKRVAAAREAWSGVAAGEAHRLHAMSESFTLLQDSLEKLYPNGQDLGHALVRASEVVGPAGVPPGLAMEVATAILYLEASLEDGDLDEPNLGERIHRLAQRIDSARRGAEPLPLDAWMEELYRRVSDNQTMGSVVQELRGSLSEIEKHIDQFFRQPEQRDVLFPVPGQLSAMRGVLSVLGLESATQAILRMREDIDQLAHGGSAPEDQVRAQHLFERLADNLGALSFMIDMLAVQPALAKALFRFDAGSGLLRALMGQPAREPAFADSIPDTGPGDLEARTQRVGRDALSNAVSDDEFARDLRSLAQQALLAEQRRLSDTLTAAQAALARTPDPDLRRTLRTELAAKLQQLGSTPESARPVAAEPLMVLSEPPAVQPVPDREAPAAAVPAQTDVAPMPAHIPAAAAETPTAVDLPHADAGQTPLPLVEPMQAIEAAEAVEATAASTASTAPSDIPGDATAEAMPEPPAPVAAAEPVDQPVAAVPMPPVAAAAPATPLPALSADDAEMLEVFLEEANEVFGQARDALARMADEGRDIASDLSEITAVRRAFHTLKGSSRMVGLPAFGEAAWACEQLYNARLAHTPTVMDAPLRGMTLQALDYLDSWAQAIGERLDRGHRPQDVVAAAEAMRLSSRVLPILLPGAAAGADALPAPVAPVPELPTETAAPADATPPPAAVTDTEPPGAEHPPLEPGERTLVLPLAAADIELPLSPLAEPSVIERAVDIPVDIPVDVTPPSPVPTPVAGWPAALDLDFDLDLDPAVAAGGNPPAPEAVPEPAPQPLPDLAVPERRTLSAADDAAGLADEAGLDAAEPAAETIAEPTAEPAAEPVLQHSDGAAHAAVPVEAAEPDDTALTPAALEEPVKVIGPLRIDIAMFNIFLNEADELSRRLSMRLGEWAVEADGPPGETAVVMAHSLAGSSATVGFADLSTLARALEHALSRSNLSALPVGAETALFNEAADDIRRMLHQFAAGFLVEPKPGLIEQLERHQPPPLDLLASDSEDLASADALEVAVDGTADALDATVDDAADVLPAPEGDDVPTAAPVQALPLEPSEPSEPAVATAPEPDLQPAAAAAAAAALALSAAAARPAAPGHRWLDEDDIDQQDSIDSELFPIFSEEAEELLPQLQSRTRDWLSRPGDRQAAAACMRTLHTFKGGARLAGAMRVGEMAHRLETAVEQLLARPAMAHGDVEPLLARVDALDAAFQSLRDAVAAAEPEAAAATLPAEAFVEDLGAVTPQPMAAEPAEGVGIDWARFARAEAAMPTARDDRASAHHPSLGAVRVRATLLDRLVNHAGEVSIARTRIESDLGQIKSSLSDLSENLERLRRQLRDVEVQAESQISSRLEAAKAASMEFDPLEMDRYTRVQELTRMMAESVNDVATVQRSLQRALQSSEDQIATQGRLTRSLQDDLLRTRMVEFESLSDRLYRVVRQAAKETGKQVRLDIVGGSIEIDRGVLERMTAPFEHLLRNSITHGIEAPAVRSAKGKDPVGLIEIKLAPEGNEVAIEFSDDGAGLDLARIEQRARAQGLLAPGDRPDEERLAELIFTPGFSTAERVTELAGRGVGMDVVRSEVLALGGRVQTQKASGGGARFRLVMPLTTAVTQVVMLRCGDLRVAVPSNLVEIVRREPAQSLEQAYRSGTWSHGGESLPFHWLGALLGGEAAGAATARTVPVVIVRSAAQRVALHVDEVLGNQEVVVKNLGPQLTRLPGLSGMTLLPSGTVAAIYNPVALVAWYGAAARQRVQQLLVTQPASSLSEVHKPVLPPAPLVLVVDDSLTVRRVTQRLLLREGYRVATAKDGLDALERIGEERPRVILSDIEMPRMDGFDFVRNLRADAELSQLPVIMITSRIAQKHRDYAAELGVRHYLGKPYSEDELLALVARFAQTETTPA